MEYNFRDIEKKWQEWWSANKIYKVSNDSDKPKYYVLDMFPYPSGTGLHVGHPLGYIASDIYSRYKRLKGFNVLHPMGYDAFGLPAEQYAIEHGIHPAVSTAANIRNFRSQLDKIGFCYDWDREVNTSKPGYYKWTQWIFLQLFNSYYDRQAKQAKPITELQKKFLADGSLPCTMNHEAFTANEWKDFDEKKQQDILMNYRLAYCGYGEVNWCEALGTVLANDEVVNGVSERGGFPVERRTLRQWYLRITEYADRLLEGLDTVDFSDAMKEMQSNWIGKSSGAEIEFRVGRREAGGGSDALTSHALRLTVYTTRPDTIFGVDFMVIAPEHELVESITSKEQKQAVDGYLTYVKSRSERERMAEKKITGVFTGAYALNPFDGREIPIWISEYVLAGYGTGAIMAVPCGDQRDFLFAKHFDIPITNIIGVHFNGEEANPTIDAQLENSDFLNDLVMANAIDVVLDKIEALGIGKRKVNYKMRDAAFSRQRYWGEPFPIIWKDGIAYPMDESELPLELPHMDELKPGPDAEGPLANLNDWINIPGGGKRESSTMPGYAGSSWYFLRYMDPDNDKEFCSRKASDYWGQVDLYIGGTEHAVGHLLYSRMWTKVLYDLGLVGHDEPYKRLVNQGMIQGSSRFVHRIHSYRTKSKETVVISDITKKPIFISNKYETDIKNPLKSSGVINELNRLIGFVKDPNSIETFFINSLHVDVNIVDGVELNIEAFKKWRSGEYANAEFLLEDGKYICGVETEKMSKSKFNTVNPDDLVFKYGADTFRMYEMFLGPVEMSKPWDTKGIEGVHRFLKKFWRLFFSEKGFIVNDEAPNAEELKVLHKTIKKIEDDTERFSFNTGVSAFMIATNELSDLKCHKRAILEPLVILLAPYAPHITEELYNHLNKGKSVLDASYPVFQSKYVAESSKEYPVSINGKLRTTMNFDLNAAQPEIEKMVLQNEVVQKWLEGKAPKKIIFVKGKMINVVM